VTLVTDVGGGGGLADLPALVRPGCFEVLAAAVLEASADGGVSREAMATVTDWSARAEAAAAGLDVPGAWARALTARAHALRAAGRPRRALPLYRDAARQFAAAGMTQAQAWTLTTAASCAVAAGQPDEAAALLPLAGELAGRCGAAAIGRRAELIRRQAASVRPAPAAPLAGLTSREREVAELAGSGKRTRNIATELSLSPRTVDVHLTRIYRKLNISSRTALARLVLESQSHPG
jgi:DNA-binding CsgD family transcriptional regulator